mgnify:CR=1 FL=1
MNAKKILALALAALMLLSLAACGQSAEPIVTEAPAEPTEAPVEATEAPAEDTSVTVTDMTGREVTLEEPATRIVALTASDCEIICALGGMDLLVGRGTYCDYPAEVQEIPSVQSGYETNIEQIIALEPQVLLMSTMAQTEEQIKALEDAGVHVVVSDAQDIEGTYAAIRMIGALLGKNEEAETVIDGMKTTFESLKGVCSANEYLTRINLMKAYLEESDTPILHSKAAAIVGGGNVAMDAARCAKRMGTEKVYIVYRRGEAEMPARLEEQHHAKEEGIEFMTLTNPTEIIGGEDGRVCGMKCIKMELGEPDASGRRRPIPVEGSEFVLDVDMVIMSLGTSPNPLIRSTTPGLETNKKGGIIVDENEMSTRENVFAGGDAVTGAATVILAMGAGKKAAEAIDRKLQGK